MKPLLFWTLAALALMLGCPWLAVTFAGTAGMAVCFLLFFGVNPLFAAFCGLAAGKHIRTLWILPIITAASFLVGTWLFFEMGEPAFLRYAAIYLLIGMTTMGIRSFFRK